MTTLGKGLIEERLKSTDPSSLLVVTPILDPSQIGGASIDVRLGFEFVSVKRGNVGVLDPSTEQQLQSRFRTPHHVNIKGRFFLHPNEMVLAATLEYVRLPTDVAGFVTSRSRWGRLGLVIATATAIHPGFAGTITLELVNHGNVPLVLYPGLCVAQLILNITAGAVAYDGELARQTGPHAVRPGEPQRSDSEFWIPAE